MKTTLRNFALAAAVGLGVLALVQTPVHAQYRRPTPVVPVPVTPVTPRTPVVLPRTPIVVPGTPVVVPRTPVVVPPVRSFTNPYVFPGMTVNQLGTLSALSMDPTLLPLINSYYNMYRPIYVTPAYPTIPYTTTFGTPVIAGNPYGIYNPYFAAYGLFP
jgi:hypothetical protein